MEKKITQEELDVIKKIKKESIEIIGALGELNYQKMMLDIVIDEQKEKVKALKVQEKSLFDQLQSKYGNVNINIETGEFE